MFFAQNEASSSDFINKIAEYRQSAKKLANNYGITPTDCIDKLSFHNIDFDEYIGSFGICAEASGTIYFQQHIPIYFNNSCINISGSYTGRYVAAGTQISCKFLNKTQLIGGGVSGSSFHFTVKRVY